ncbi:MAG: CARDB domain-containing protein [Candidatus Gracilibacteria bacterium]
MNNSKMQKKHFLVLLLVVIVTVGVFSQVKNSLNKNLSANVMETNQKDELAPLPDIKADLTVTFPDKDAEDQSMIITATITNVGDGKLYSGNPFSYGLYLGNTQLFTNTDSYTEMASGDSFSFDYPLDEFPKSGEIKFVVDSKNAVEEGNEENNTAVIKY